MTMKADCARASSLRRRWPLSTGFVLLSLVLGACGATGPTVTPVPTLPTITRAAQTSVAATVAGAMAPPTSAAGVTTMASSVAATGGMTADPRGPAPAKRGGAGTLHLLWWQAPTVINFHLASNTKDWDAARIVEEPLVLTSVNAASPDVPVLAKEIPTAQNGELAADGTTVTIRLRDNVQWSDGSPFTAGDVQATYAYVTKPENAATDVAKYQNIATLDTPDATTVRITFKKPTVLWYLPAIQPVLQKAQIEQCADAKTCTLATATIGTGPYKVKSFSPGDNAQYVMNERYREPDAPAFDALDLKGGGDATTAAKAVQTGAADFAWNLQVTPDILKQVTDAGKTLAANPGGGTELVYLNFTDPNKEVDGERSSVKAPHPFLTDKRVREAMSWLVDRDGIAKSLYGASGAPACNVLIGVPPPLKSLNTMCGFDVAKANQILDDAGYRKGPDGIRAKNGVRLQVVFSASINPVREKQQQVMKAAFQQAGIGMEIRNADASVFYGMPDNPDQFYRFQSDLELNARARSTPDAEDFFSEFTTTQIPQKANNWSTLNIGRYSDPDYDRLFAQLTREFDPQKRIQLQIQLNDKLTNDYVRIPIVDRFIPSGYRPDLMNVNVTPWDSVVWNVAHWQLKR